MRSEIIIKTFGTYSELNKEQQAKAIESNRYINVDSTSWWEHTKEDFHHILGLLGFTDIHSEFSGFCSQGDGARFSAKFKRCTTNLERAERLTAVEMHAPRYLDDDLKEDFRKILIVGADDDSLETEEIYVRGNYANSSWMFSDDDCLLSVARDLADKYYRDLEQEYDALSSDACVAESLIANEVEFLIHEEETK